MTDKQAAIFGALVIVMTFFGGMWFLFYHQMTNPDNGVQVIEIPVEQLKTTSGKALSLEEETVTVEVMPDNNHYNALASPLGFMVLMFGILGAGVLMLWRMG